MYSLYLNIFTYFIRRFVVEIFIIMEQVAEKRASYGSLGNFWLLLIEHLAKVAAAVRATALFTALIFTRYYCPFFLTSLYTRGRGCGV